mmetsp:Transcript_87657/g.220573  ORF Transcript_87657/g.220573 Transcript_87657/m.220573 type:complete len:642 (+) Transcript_87657:76-2001(+)
MAVLPLARLAWLGRLLPLIAAASGTDFDPSSCAAVSPSGACLGGGLNALDDFNSNDAGALLQVAERSAAARQHRQEEGEFEHWPRKQRWPKSNPNWGGEKLTEDDIDSTMDGVKSRAPNEAKEISKCFFLVCANLMIPDRNKKCMDCIAAWARGWPMFEKEVGPTGVPLGYVVNMLEIPFTQMMVNESLGIYVYNKVFCGDIDITGCSKKKNFPGPGTTSYLDHASVKKLGSQYPRKTWTGEIWRGHELGLLIQYPHMWSGKPTMTQPFGLALGMLPSQHVNVRPVLMQAFNLGGKNSWKYKNAEKVIGSMIRQFLDNRKAAGKMRLKNDVLILVHQILNKVAFNLDVSRDEAREFIEHQTLAMAVGTLGVLVPTELAFLLNPVRNYQTKLIQKYEPVVDKIWGKKLNQSACAPTESCTLQVAASLVDGLLFAGGLSVPTDISTGLGTLYSTHPSNPFPQRSIPKGKELNFFWENIRLFAPVLGFPSWTKRPTCPGLSEEETAALNKKNGKTEACPPTKANWQTGYGEINQYQGGEHVAPTIALAQRDPKVWGKNANDFVLRPLTEYMKNSVGFAEMAEDKWVQGGKNDNSCPGKSLALMIGSKFFELFKKEEWVAKAPENITFVSGPTWVEDFALLPAAP